MVSIPAAVIGHRPGNARLIAQLRHRAECIYSLFYHSSTVTTHKNTYNRVRTDSSSDTDRGPIWLNLDWTRSAGVDRPGLTVTRVNGDGNPC